MTKLIVEMEMPTNCNECEAKCVSALCGRICGMTRKNIMPFLDKPNRPDWCPIKGEIVPCAECVHSALASAGCCMYDRNVCVSGKRKE